MNGVIAFRRLGDRNGVVRAIEQYRDDRELRSREERAARELYQRRFTREKSIGAFVKLIEDVAGR